MAANDYAVVVGIDRYASDTLDDLQGPTADARAFATWLRSPTGGDVPDGQVLVLLSPDFEALDEPTPDNVRRPLDTLHDRLKETPQLGRRLYLYFAGHGATMTGGSPLSAESAAFLCANATLDRLHHVPSVSYAEWFRWIRCFEEVVLFMDCCRTAKKFAPRVSIWYDWPEREDGHEASRYLYGFATAPAGVAYECALGDPPEMRGLFTAALLAALQGGADREGTGQITSTMLKAFVAGYVMKHTESLNVPINQYPRFEFGDDAPVFAVKPSSKYEIRLTTRPGHRSTLVELYNSSLEVVDRKLLTLEGWIWQVQAFGAYILVVDDHRILVPVAGDRAVINVRVTDGNQLEVV